MKHLPNSKVIVNCRIFFMVLGEDGKYYKQLKRVGKDFPFNKEERQLYASYGGLMKLIKFVKERDNLSLKEAFKNVMDRLHSCGC